MPSSNSEITVGAPPEWQVATWLNASDDITLASLRGKVVALEAFQMLCPACVAHGLPQVKRLARAFPDDLQVLGLHAVFEHHAAMGPVALEAFLHEYRIDFPVGIDAPGDGALPRTMEAYAMRGTPSLLLFDAEGRLRAHRFGQVDDIELGALVARLVDEARDAP
ncbi:MAG: redoxin domain-containing protein [Planctomycetota bacterium]